MMNTINVVKGIKNNPSVIFRSYSNKYKYGLANLLAIINNLNSPTLFYSAMWLSYYIMIMPAYCIKEINCKINIVRELRLT